MTDPGLLSPEQLAQMSGEVEQGYALTRLESRLALQHIAAQEKHIVRLEVLMAWLDPAICYEDDSPITTWLGVEWSTWESINRVDQEVAEIRLRGVEYARQARGGRGD